MDKTTFLIYLEGTKALGHLLIGSLALISSKGIDNILIFNDGSTKTVRLNISDLLRQLNFFSINEFDHSSKYNFPLESAAKLMEQTSPFREKSIHLLFLTALTLPIVRAFELIKSYCNETNQFSKFKNQNWYFVAWVFRNCFNHEFILEIRGDNMKRLLPYTWKDITITEDMLGKPLLHSNVKIGSITNLFDTMTNIGTLLD